MVVSWVMAKGISKFISAGHILWYSLVVLLILSTDMVCATIISPDLNTILSGSERNYSPPKEKLKAPRWLKFVRLFEFRRWLIADSKQLFETNDGGSSWTKLYEVRNSTNDWYGINALSFANSVSGCLVEGDNYNSRLLRTRNGGGTWEDVGRIELENRKMFLRSCHFSDDDRGWCGGLLWSAVRATNSEKGLYEGIILRTDDGGRTWRR